MNRDQLLRTFAWFRARPVRLRLLKDANRFCTGFTCAVFAAAVGWLAVCRGTAALRLLLICGVPFAVLSVFRRLLNWPRPYEVYGLAPLLKKETQGRSFPSRHVFSICVIGVSMLYLTPPLGIVLLVLAAVLAAVRVVSGVHFLRDVAAGAALGVFSAVAGAALWPL